MLKKDKMSEIVIYQSPDDQTQIEVKFEGDTAWLTQKQMAELFQTTPQNITLHLKNIYAEDEIEENSTCKEYLQVQKEGKRQVNRKQLIYNLDAILSVGYRINSKRGTQFRQWATHPFSDGNKRIGAFLFIWFLEKNKHRFKQNGELKINDNGLVALALLVAQSNPDDKELMIQLIINLINNR